jgi:putative heme-binding domain-containing protein
MRLLLILAVGPALEVSGLAQESRPSAVPLDSPAAVEEGRSLFQTHCLYCHGARGEGGRGADLTTGQYRLGGTEGELYRTIRNGIAGTEMPAVRASDEEVWKMVAFVKRIGNTSVRENAAGDPIAGKAIFERKGACATCHAIGREGGSLGPELTDVGRRRSLKYLEESIAKPDADVPIRYRAIQVVTKAGRTVTGIRLNEDDLSIQLRDQNDDLQSFLKEDLREIQRDRPSLMPSYEKALSRKEMDDLVAYLNSLRGEQ